MGNWINRYGWSIASTHMSDRYLADVISYMALGGEAPVDVVLGFMDEAYAEARKRGLVYGLWGRLLKWHTARLWKNGAPLGKRIPWWVHHIISTKIPYNGSCE